MQVNYCFDKMYHLPTDYYMHTEYAIICKSVGINDFIAVQINNSSMNYFYNN